MGGQTLRAYSTQYKDEENHIIVGEFKNAFFPSYKRFLFTTDNTSHIDISRNY